MGIHQARKRVGPKHDAHHEVTDVREVGKRGRNYIIKARVTWFSPFRSEVALFEVKPDGAVRRVSAEEEASWNRARRVNGRRYECIKGHAHRTILAADKCSAWVGHIRPTAADLGAWERSQS